jgi:hypothetical protein
MGLVSLLGIYSSNFSVLISHPSSVSFIKSEKATRIIKFLRYKITGNTNSSVETQARLDEASFNDDCHVTSNCNSRLLRLPFTFISRLAPAACDVTCGVLNLVSWYLVTLPHGCRCSYDGDPSEHYWHVPGAGIATKLWAGRFPVAVEDFSL